MLIDLNDHVAKNNLQNQCNAKTYTEFFIWTEKMNHPKSKMEAQKTLCCQSNPQQNEQCCSDLPATIQSYSNKKKKHDTETKQTWENMEQNRRPKYEGT